MWCDTHVYLSLPFLEPRVKKAESPELYVPSEAKSISTDIMKVLQKVDKARVFQVSQMLQTAMKKIQERGTEREEVSNLMQDYYVQFRNLLLESPFQGKWQSAHRLLHFTLKKKLFCLLLSF